MQRMWKQSPKQSVYKLRLHTQKSPATKNYMELLGAAAPSASPWIRHWLHVGSALRSTLESISQFDAGFGTVERRRTFNFLTSYWAG